ncbi:hypothetical protein B0H34DRAFT_736564 [Crassisporium funariophilum]|nr:hypothetical protein B0H34DRAFT_739272 [Crassisporium funariophilum]KAF8148682.1 hypothetical protein B0H34DRAFT_736564 [Crassisporium funariophilum]
MSKMDGSESLERIPELWFPDGSVVLEAENKHFRVHKGVIAAHSSVFKDMFDSLPSAGDEERVEGCAVIHLANPAESVQHFLMAIFNASFFEPPPSHTTLSIVQAIARLSYQYEVKFLLRRALAHLETHCPLTLDGWKTRGITSTLLEKPSRGLDLVSKKLEVVHTIYLVKALWLLPAAMYDLCLEYIRDIVKNTQWDECNIGGLQDFCISVWAEHSLMLQVHFSSMLSTILSQRCADQLVCLRAALYSACEWPMESRSRSPIISAQQYLDLVRGELCKDCRRALLEGMEIVTNEFWTMMPHGYGMPSWDELKIKRAAIFA